MGSTLPVCRAKMLLAILLLNLVLCRASADADAKSPPKEGLEDLAEKLEFRLKDVETKMHQNDKEMGSKEKEMETRLDELEDKMREEKEKMEKELKASMSQLRMEVEEYSNFSNTALTNPTLRDLPIVLISALHSGTLTSPQTVTFD